MSIQIGVIGSKGKTQSGDNRELARRIGAEIASHGATLLFGWEDDGPSLPGIAAEGARSRKGRVVAFLRAGAIGADWDIVIHTGAERGGGREFPFIKSCDVLICLGGGSGTLMEIAIAYQARIPIIAMAGSGGWTEKLAGTFLDKRKALPIETAHSAREAVDRAMALAKAKQSVV